MDMDEKTKSAKEHISEIRREDFWIDEDGNQIGKLPEKQNRYLQNALKEIAGNLYREEEHFIMELIQNADDNKYVDNVRETLSFRITYF